jgi:lysozyme
MRKINQAGEELVKHFEGLYLESYLCPAGVWTIGWGHTGPDVRQGMQISIERAQELFELDMEYFEQAVERLVRVPVTDNQFAALVSFAYNVGSDEDIDLTPEGLGDSTLLKLLNQGKYAAAADQFPFWVYGGGRVLPGLERRRKMERELFLRPDGPLAA